MSNVIKASHYFAEAQKRIIEHKWSNKDLSIDHSNSEDFESEAKSDTYDPISQMMNDALLEIEQLRQKAREEIERLREQQLQEIEDYRQNVFAEAQKEGYEQGYRLGYEEGLSQGESVGLQNYQEKIDQAKALIEQAEVEWKKRVLEAEPFLLNLAVDIAERILHREIMRDDQAIIDLVKNTLKLTSELKEVTICVHPDDYSRIKEALPILGQSVSSEAKIIVLPDWSILCGGCIIKTSLGNLDARLDTQLEEVRKALQEAVKGSEAIEFIPTRQI